MTCNHEVKTLIAIYKVPNRVFNASACGDNCAKWILKIAKLQDTSGGTSSYTITVDTYETTADFSGASEATAWEDYEVEEP